MHRSFTPQAWVKNVYDLRVISGVICGFISPYSHNEQTYSQSAGEKHTFYTLNTLTQPAFFSTVFLDNLHLLMRDLYLFSTRPTMTKTIKKLINNS